MQHLVDGDLAIDHWQWQMQAGITNPLSDTFRIYNPNKNIEDRDKDLQFIYHWVPELHGYSLPEILNGVYLGESPYPAPVLDWAQTRKINGLIVSNLRKKVKQRLIESVSDELQTARKVKTTVDKYFQAQAKQYQKYQHQQQNHQI
jgi:deoxyribodipyrimidine photo-lyase